MYFYVIKNIFNRGDFLQNKQIYIADTLHKTILLSVYEKEVISTQLFNRLHNISQNSTAYMTFPTNRTKRFEHSLGTMKLCGDIFYFSINNASETTLSNFFAKFKEELKKEIIDKVILSNNEQYRYILGDENLSNKKLSQVKFNKKSVFYSNFIPYNVKAEHTAEYLILFQAIRISGLLHDIGHPPFSHITENAMNSIYRKLKSSDENKNDSEKEYIDLLDKYIGSSNKSQLHENMGKIMTKKMVSDLLYNDSKRKNNNGFDESYFKILVFEVVKCIFSESSMFFESLHKIIDGTIDGDRLDYVCRDISNSGISGSIIEYDRLISSMKLIKDEIDSEKYSFDSDVKTINTIEDFLFKRWNLYKNIIYHHRVIKTDSLLQNCIENLILEYLQKDNAVDNDEDIKVLPNDISGLWKAINIAHSNKDYFNALIQWDDYWLLTILKKSYFSSYIDSDNPIKYQLEELLSNKKNYFSVIKNHTDFQIFSDEFKVLMSELEEYDNNFKSFKEKLIIKYPTIGCFYIIISYCKVYLDLDIDNVIKQKVEPYISTNVEHITDRIVSFKEIKSGISTMPTVYKNEETFLLNQFSNIKNTLDIERFNFPYLYIYLKFEDSYRKDIGYERLFLENLGKYVSTEIKKLLIPEE